MAPSPLPRAYSRVGSTRCGALVSIAANRSQSTPETISTLDRVRRRNDKGVPASSNPVTPNATRGAIFQRCVAGTTVHVHAANTAA
ncbi:MULTISPECIES: hypothetical protein [unclassified Rhodococcus (in: high G+C Gram-positive bacteria)]|uniref:hypothetical protein n=1 Tax=unclassified Rhodococcus (in: high G+C Gram-positive bacteria) TaxID=192944 RepID=UPI00339AB0C6